MTYGRWFKVWWWDGRSQHSGFFEEDLQHYAKEFDFNPDQLLRDNEVDFLDEFGAIVGGVVLDDE